MEEWKEYKLGDLIKLSSGGTPDKNNDSYWGGAIPWISAKSMYDDYLYSSDLTITNEGLVNGSRIAPVNSILLLTRGSGLFNRIPVCLVKKEMAFNQDVKCLESKDQDVVSNLFLYYWLMGNKHEISAIIETTGIGAGKIDTERLKNIKVKLPPVRTQKALVQFAESIMLKIEVNRRINDNLEQQAQALFKSWFVDFEPFKDGEFVESEMGMIPKGWKVGNLFDVAEVLDKYRKPLSGQERDLMDKIYPYYGATSCMDYVDDYLFDGIYTLIGEDGSVVKEDGFPYMQYVWGKLWVNNHAHILQGKNGFSTEMLHVMLSTTNIRHLVTGAVQAKLSQANMRKIFVAIPSTNVLDEIKPTFDKLYQLIRKNEDESRRLAQLRDTLLPRLMSGELKVEAGF